MEATSQRYKKGDSVKIITDDPQKNTIVKIIEIIEKKSTFVFQEYRFPQDLQNGREPHHGKKQIFLTDEVARDFLSNIVQKVNVLPLKEYIQTKISSNGQIDEFTYLSRQEYETDSKKFKPEKLDDILGTTINPDNEFISINILTGELQLLEDKLKSDTSSKRNKLTLNLSDSSSSADGNVDKQMQGMSPVKQVKSEFDENKIYEKLMNFKKNESSHDASQNANNRKSNLNSDRSNNFNNQTEQASPEAESPTTKTQPFQNLQEKQIQQITAFANRYQLDSGYSKLKGTQKRRQDVKERFFQVFLYGLMEMKNKEETLSTDDQKYINHVEFYDESKKIVGLLENFLIMIKNHGIKDTLSEEYKERCQILLNNLKDEKNFELRRKILTQRIELKDLCLLPAESFYNPEKKHEIEQARLRELEQNYIKNDLYIIQTGQGQESIIDVRQDNPLEQANDRNLDFKDSKNENSKNSDNERKNQNERFKREQRENDSSSQNLSNNRNKNEIMPIKDISNNAITFIQDQQYADILKSVNSNIDQDLIVNLLDLMSDQAYQQMAERINEEINNKEIKANLLGKIQQF